MRKRLLAYLSVFAAAVALSGAPAQAGDSTAVAINTKDGSTIVKVVFDIERIVMGHDVDTTNAAVAVASCNSCETVAIAIQIVLASGSPSVVVPQNIAIAMNVDCNLCQTLADAYQYVYAGEDRMTFTKDGTDRIKEIQKQLHDLEKSGLPIEQIQARVEELTAQIQDVLKTELVPVDHGPQGADGQVQPTTGTDTGPADTGTAATPADTGTETTPSDTATSTTPSDTGTSTSPADTGTSTSPAETGTSTTPSETGTQTTPSDTGTSTTPSDGTAAP
jgi:putative peptide zinc metalloprotease protein